jgi:type I restriction enzyme S subunit
MSKEIKLIPELRFPEFLNDGEWELKELSNAAEIITGNTPSTKETSYYGGDKMFVSPADISDTRIVSETKTTLTELGFSKTRQIEANSVLFVCIGSTIGKVAQNKFECATNQQINSLVADSGYSSDFLYSLLDYNSTVIASIAGNHAVPIINKTTFSAVKLPFPPRIGEQPQEQQKIASCLSSLDELIAAHNDKLQALKDHKKGLMQILFPQEGETVPKFRFKEFEDDGEWIEKSFEDLFTIGNGRDYKHLKEGDVPVHGSGGYMLSVDEYLYEGDSACIGRKGTINNPLFLTGKFWTVDTLFYTHSFKDCIPKFVFYIFQNIDWLRHNEAGGVPSLSKTNIYKIETVVPKPNEQELIVDFLSGMDDVITIQMKKIEQLQQHKKGMMQGLFPKIES